MGHWDDDDEGKGYTGALSNRKAGGLLAQEKYNLKFQISSTLRLACAKALQYEKEDKC